MRKKRWDLATAALTALARTGHAVGLELCADVEHDLGLAPGNRAVKRAVMEDLPSLGWAYKETPRVMRGVKLSLLRLDWDGAKALYRLGVKAVNGEWETMIEKHNGERYARHTLGVLILAWQARKRGHRARLLPGRKQAYSQVYTWVEPDLEINFDANGAHTWIPFEVETRVRHKMEKWRKWEKQTGGWGVCVFSAKQRESMRRELEQAGCHAWMLDIETLMREPEAELFDWRPR